jgi:hypothetical protein
MDAWKEPNSAVTLSQLLSFPERLTEISQRSPVYLVAL